MNNGARFTSGLMVTSMLWSAVAGAQNAPPPAPAGAAVVRTVQEIKFTGNKKISTATLSSGIALKVGDVNTKEAVGAAMTKIVELYKQAGSDLALMVDISLPDASHTVVNFLIDENGTGGNKGAAPRPGRGGGPGGPGGPPPPAPQG